MDELFLPTSRHRWYLLQTKPHQESKVFGILQRLLYDCIFLQLECKQLTGSVREEVEPLFPRYLLVKLDSPASVATVREIDGATRFLKMNDEVVPMEDNLVTILHNFCSSSKVLTEDGWASVCARVGMEEGGGVEHSNPAARALQLVELVCQAERRRMVSRPLRRVA